MRPVFLLAGALALASTLAGQAPPDDEDWASSPEAYFLTREERSEWDSLSSRSSRDDFRSRYWLKRDPTPGTERNEFRESVLGRIRTADSRFGIQKIKGSRTARGMVFVLFGTPARVQDSHARQPPAPRSAEIGDPSPAVGFQEGTETSTTWLYDRDRTPQVLDAIGKPSLSITIVIEPQRRSDKVQNPGLVNEYREVLARKSIVNPDLVPAPTNGGAAPGAPAAPAAPATKPLTAAVRAVLAAAAPPARSPEGAFFSSAVLWPDSGDAEALVWFFVPQGSGSATFHSLVRADPGGEEILAISEPVAPSRDFSSSAIGATYLRRLRLPPGAYSAAFALTRDPEPKPIAAASAVLRVPALGDALGVSSLLVTRGPAAAAGAPTPFTIGNAVLPPRADGTFSRKESLWYFLEVANPPDPQKVSLEIRLRRGSEQLGSRPPFPAGLTQIAPGRYVCGYEMPLADVAAGDYRIYAVVRTGATDPAVRGGEFRVVE